LVAAGLWGVRNRHLPLTIQKFGCQQGRIPCGEMQSNISFFVFTTQQAGIKAKKCIPSLGDFLIAIHLATLFLFFVRNTISQNLEHQNFVKPHSKNIS